MKNSNLKTFEIEEERLMAAILTGVYAGMNCAQIDEDDDHLVDSVSNLYEYWNLVKDMEIPYTETGLVDTEMWRDSVWCAVKDKYNLYY